MLKMNFSADKRPLVIFPRLRLPSQLSYADLMPPPHPPTPFASGGQQAFFSVARQPECVRMYTFVMKTLSVVCSVLTWTAGVCLCVRVCVFEERTRGRKFNFHSLSSVGDYTESLADFAPSLALTKYLQCIVRHALHPAFPFFPGQVLNRLE